MTEQTKLKFEDSYRTARGLQSKIKRKAVEQAEIDILEAELPPVKVIKMKIEATKSVKGQIEETFLRFPHLGEQILENLDDQSLLKCKKVSRQWSNFVTETKALPIELLRKYTFISVARLKKSLQNHKIKIIQKLANCAVNEHKSMPYLGNTGQARLIYQMTSKNYLHNIQYFLIELMLQNVTDKNLTKKPDQGFSDLLFYAVRNGHFPICKFITEKLKDAQNDKPWGMILIATANHHGYHDISKLLISSFQIQKMK